MRGKKRIQTNFFPPFFCSFLTFTFFPSKGLSSKKGPNSPRAGMIDSLSLRRKGEREEETVLFPFHSCPSLWLFSLSLALERLFFSHPFLLHHTIKYAGSIIGSLVFQRMNTREILTGDLSQSKSERQLKKKQLVRHRKQQQQQQGIAAAGESLDRPFKGQLSAQTVCRGEEEEEEVSASAFYILSLSSFSSSSSSSSLLLSFDDRFGCRHASWGSRSSRRRRRPRLLLFSRPLSDSVSILSEQLWQLQQQLCTHSRTYVLRICMNVRSSYRQKLKSSPPFLRLPLLPPWLLRLLPL